MISLTQVVNLIVYGIVAGLIFGVLLWLIDICKVPEPFNKALRVGLAILAALVLIGMLLQLVGGTPVFRP